MKRYFAIFKKSARDIEVYFPDLEGCLSFGKDWDEALENATDVLSAWLANADPKYIKKPSMHKLLSKKLKRNEELVPIAIDPNVLESYQKLKRFNVIFPAQTLAMVDAYRKQLRMKRSKFLIMAVQEYLNSRSAHTD